MGTSERVVIVGLFITVLLIIVATAFGFCQTLAQECDSGRTSACIQLARPSPTERFEQMQQQQFNNVMTGLAVENLIVNSSRLAHSRAWAPVPLGMPDVHLQDEP